MLKRILKRSNPAGFSRREFLGRALAAGVVAGIPEIIPSSAVGLNGQTPPSDRLVMAVIGAGGRGTYDLSTLLQFPEVHFVAACDVQRNRRNAAKNKIDETNGNKDCVLYRDFRDLLNERQDLDAVLIATGDRWHTPASIMAMESGLDVYCEKPCTMSVAEGHALMATARRHGRVFQAGMQRLSEANFVFADELVRLGLLGSVHTVRAHIIPWKMTTAILPAQPEPDRETLDWDLWLGPAPRRPFNKGYLGGCMAWLDYYDFGTGVAGWGSHTICQCQSALGLKESSAVEYNYPGNNTAEGFEATYANGVKLVLAASGWRGTCGVRYEGTEGWVSVADAYSRPDVSSPSLLREYDKIIRDYRDRTQRPLHHVRDFLESVRRRRSCIASDKVAHHTMVTNHLANISMLLKRNIRWDPEKAMCVNDDEGNRLLSRAMRVPWHL